MTKTYSDSEFMKDLEKLSELLNEKKEGGAKSLKKKVKKSSLKKVKKTKKVVKKRVKSTEKRHFKIVEINGKSKRLGDFYVSKLSGTPSSAAKKALRSVCTALKIKGAKRIGCKVTFCIQEVTRGSKNKVYGPYKGSYKAIPKSEQVVLPGGVVRKVKPIVKLLPSK